MFSFDFQFNNSVFSAGLMQHLKNCVYLPPQPKKWRNKNGLVEVSSNLHQNPSPPAKSRQRKWVKKDIPPFTMLEPVCRFCGQSRNMIDWAYHQAYQLLLSPTDWGICQHDSCWNLRYFVSCAVHGCFFISLSGRLLSLWVTLPISGWYHASEVFWSAMKICPLQQKLPNRVWKSRWRRSALFFKNNVQRTMPFTSGVGGRGVVHFWRWQGRSFYT